jgi:lipoate-protein ligase B
MEPSSPRAIELIRLGRVSYSHARSLQERLYREIRSGERQSGALLLLEHPDTITVGRAPGASLNVLAGEEELGRLGIELVRADRGGDVTWHGPGQLVAYPIVPLRDYRKDVGWYLRTLERAGVEVCRSFGVRANTLPGRTGVWTDRGKVMAIGVGVGGWVTYHGLALNCEVDLSRYRLIVPCGLAGGRATSLTELAGRRITVDDAAPRLAAALCDALGAEPVLPARRQAEEVPA